MNSFDPQLHILPQAQRELWPSLAPLEHLGFVLYGGTAAALRLGHRTSIDFDFFSHRALEPEKIMEAMPVLQQASLIQADPNARSFLINGVKLSFFGSISFGRIGIPEITADGVMLVAALEDLMPLKIKVILQRSEAKDYIDIAAMLRAGVSLERGLAVAEKMFHPQLSAMVALRALTYFEDGDLSTLSDQDRRTLTLAVQNLKPLPEIGPLATTLT
jgi:hypothetical protein